MSAGRDPLLSGYLQGGRLSEVPAEVKDQLDTVTLQNRKENFLFFPSENLQMKIVVFITYGGSSF